MALGVPILKHFRVHNEISCISLQLVTYGDTRTEALDTMVTALDSYVIKGMLLP